MNDSIDSICSESDSIKEIFKACGVPIFDKKISKNVPEIGYLDRLHALNTEMICKTF